MDDLPDPMTHKGAIVGDTIDVEGTDEPKRYGPKTIAQREKLFNVLRDVGAFSRHDDELINDIIDFCKLRKFHMGEVVFYQGDPGHHFYIVDSGDFDVIQTIDGRDKVVHTYRGSGIFGEPCLYFDNDRVASVKAMTEGMMRIIKDIHTYFHSKQVST